MPGSFVNTVHVRFPDKGHYTEAPNSAWLAIYGMWFCLCFFSSSSRSEVQSLAVEGVKFTRSPRPCQLCEINFKGAELIDSVLDVVRKEAEGDGSWASSISEHILRLACSEHSV